jgi:hypothetical protein
MTNRGGIVGKRQKATLIILTALIVAAMGVSQAAPKATRRVAKGSLRPKLAKRTPARPCAATTLPALPGDGPAFAQDIDRDGVLDLTVTNPTRRELRVAFSNGPELVIPLEDAQGGRVHLGSYAVPWDPKAFALRWLMSSSGFYIETLQIFRRDKCILTNLPFPSDPPTVKNQTSRFFMAIGSSKGVQDDGLRCDGNDIFRVRHSTTWTSFSIFTTTIWKWQYSYTPTGFGLLKTYEIETQTDVSGDYVPIGKDCFTNPLHLLI